MILLNGGCAVVAECYMCCIRSSGCSRFCLVITVFQTTRNKLRFNVNVHVNTNISEHPPFNTLSKHTQMDTESLTKELHLLARRQQTLQARLSVLRASKTTINKATNTKSTAQNFQRKIATDALLAQGKEELEEQEEFDNENLSRFTGTTAFRVKNHSGLLGVRIEHFSEDTGTFEAPFYLILKRLPDEKHFEVFKHTIPSYVPLRSLEKQYLKGRVDLLAFVRRVRRSIQQFLFKRRVFQELKSLGAGVEADQAYRMVQLTLQDATYTLVCGPTRVERVVEKHSKPYLLGPLSGLRRRIVRANR